MTYQVPVSLPEILRTTPYLVDHTEYVGKESKAVYLSLRECLIDAIAELSLKETTNETKDETGSSSD